MGDGMINKRWLFLFCVLGLLFIFSCTAGIGPGTLILRWTSTFSNPNDSTDQVNDFWITDDGGTVGIGRTFNPDNGVWDIWVVKADAQGEEEWNRTFGGTENDEGIGVFQTADGDFLLVGNAQSANMNGMRARNPSKGDWSIWVARLDHQGEIRWESFFGGEAEDKAYAVKPHSTDKGLFYVLGSTRSERGDLETTPHYGNADAWAFLASLDSPGEIILQGRYGGKEDDVFYDLVEWDGQVEFLVGVSSSDLSYTTGRFPPSSRNLWFVLPDNQLLNANEGNHFLFGGSNDESFNSGFWEADGYYWLAGSTRSHDGDIPAPIDARLPPTNQDGILFRFKVGWDTGPSIDWRLRVGSAGEAKAFGILPIAQDEWLAGFQSYAPEGAHSRQSGRYENILLSLSPDGKLLWQRLFPVDNVLLQTMRGVLYSDAFYVYGEVFPSSRRDERSLDDSDWFLAFSQLAR